MKRIVWQRLDSFARNLVPLTLTVALVLFSVVPLHIPGYAAIVPMLVLISVYYWAIHRPGLLPPLAVFAVGLAQDALSGAPFGLHAVVLLLAYGAVVSQRRFFLGKSFLVVWWGFMLVALGAALAAWVLASALAGAVIGPRAALFQYLVTLALYPIVIWVFLSAQRVIPRRP